MRTDSVGDINRLQAFHDRRAAFAVPEDVTFLNSAHIGPRLHAVRAAEKFVLAECGAVEGLSPTPAAWRATHFLRFRTDGGRAAAIAGALREQQVFVPARGDTIRVAPHLHTTMADVARLAAALRRAR